MKGLKYTTEEYVKICKENHPNCDYDYSKTEYTGSLNDVCVICQKHGEFYQPAYRHLKGAGCPTCAHEKDAKNKTSNTDEWKAKALLVWGGRYNYDKSVYVNDDTKICITCDKHGDWWQRPSSHLAGYGCPKCKHDTIREKKSIRYGKQFLEKAKKIHGDKYGYEYVEYINEVTPVKIVCNKHGIFEQQPCVHLSGCGCPQCKFEQISERSSLTQDEFVKRANEVHNFKYCYDKSVYKGYGEPVEIYCPNHGYYWQIAGIHMKGCGCPKCAGSHGEREISKFLDKHSIPYEVQYVIQNESLFSKRDKFYVDFKLKDHDVFIEFNGQHHYESVKHFHSHGFAFEDQQERDMALRLYCEERKIKLIEIPYWDINNIDTILSKELKSIIKQY